MASEPTYPLYLTRDQLWLLKEQLAAAADPEQRSPEESGLLRCIEWLHGQAVKGEQVRPSVLRRLFGGH
ncbi:hypothetical protein C6A77_19405 [Pseudomonas sp. AFG_SD02_1510_Pfu_092]|uniref:hypothetical protein n=1 Tax=Pseudomonas sp. AFG_SD02_1510_Pfu_092 TaxID=2259497 RepID=UPI000DEEE1B5|nr:hypothetical protein [Pseudomonas sp. AFG_SD02_1510_Pfu_092]RCL23007.1 hypothetical protein C6A77_19405 [Pseudomonas sp. AFG_SD02_1510_Pfu_092]